MSEFSGELSLNLRDLLILNILVEVASYNIPEYYEVYNGGYEFRYKKGTDTGIYTGIKIGRKPGLIANIAAALTLGIIVGLYLISDGD